MIAEAGAPRVREQHCGLCCRKVAAIVQALAHAISGPDREQLVALGRADLLEALEALQRCPGLALEQVAERRQGDGRAEHLNIIAASGCVYGALQLLFCLIPSAEAHGEGCRRQAQGGFAARILAPDSVRCQAREGAANRQAGKPHQVIEERGTPGTRHMAFRGADIEARTIDDPCKDQLGITRELADLAAHERRHQPVAADPRGAVKPACHLVEFDQGLFCPPQAPCAPMRERRESQMARRTRRAWPDRRAGERARLLKVLEAARMSAKACRLPRSPFIERRRAQSFAGARPVGGNPGGRCSLALEPPRKALVERPLETRRKVRDAPVGQDVMGWTQSCTGIFLKPAQRLQLLDLRCAGLEAKLRKQARRLLGPEPCAPGTVHAPEGDCPHRQRTCPKAE